MKKYLLSVFSLVGLAVSQSAFAWTPVLECDNRALVVDEQCSPYRGAPCYITLRQLVINDAGIVRYLHEQGAIRGNYADAGQYIQHRNVNRNNPEGSSFTAMSSAADGRHVALYLNRKHDGLLLEAFEVRRWMSPYGEQHIENERKIADWYFQKCWNRGPVSAGG